MKNAAFSLVELMVTLAIISILAGLGVPAYQDYVRRAYVAEALTLMEPLKHKVAENAATGTVLTSGITPPTPTKAVSSVEVGIAGTITAKFTPTYFNNNSYGITLTPFTNNGSPTAIVAPGGLTEIPTGSVHWACTASLPTGTGRTSTLMPFEYLPPSCQNRTFTDALP